MSEIREAVANNLRNLFHDAAMREQVADAAISALPVTLSQLEDIAAGRACVVPVEATTTMLDAGGEAGASPNGSYSAIWSAMLAAARKDTP